MVKDAFDSTSGNAGQVRFFNPGPVWVRPQILQALGGPMLSHRSQAFMDLYGRILEKLPKVFRTTGSAHTLATSATGVWEAALVSCVEGGPVLCCCNGAFSDKWGEMCQRLGLETDILKGEWGKGVHPAGARAPAPVREGRAARPRPRGRTGDPLGAPPRDARRGRGLGRKERLQILHRTRRALADGLLADPGRRGERGGAEQGAQGRE